MELLFFAIILIIIVSVINAVSSQDKKDSKQYSYRAKDHIMTPTEEEFFRMLLETVSDKYFVFPQIHLSAILEYAEKDKGSLYAFRHINQKSVDYVLCEKTTLRPVYAIELDDYTHRINKDRFDRDLEFERIFKEANIPLVRFKNNIKMTPDKIITKLSEAYISHNS